MSYISALTAAGSTELKRTQNCTKELRIRRKISVLSRIHTGIANINFEKSRAKVIASCNISIRVVRLSSCAYLTRP